MTTRTTVTDRCRDLEWGDAAGHYARGEKPCPRCAALVGARVRLNRFKTGHGIKLTATEHLSVLAAIKHTWQPGIDAQKALYEAVKHVLIAQAPSTRNEETP